MSSSCSVVNGFSRWAVGHGGATEGAQHRVLVEAAHPTREPGLALVVTGMLKKQIASELGVAEKTVKVHRGPRHGEDARGSVAELVRLAGGVGVIATEA